MSAKDLLIYVDEDDREVETTLLQFLAELGHTAICCASFHDVQNKLAATDRQPKAVITNVVEMEATAAQRLQQTHQKYPQVVFLLTTNGSRDLTATEAAACGVYAFLREPLWINELELFLIRLSESEVHKTLKT